MRPCPGLGYGGLAGVDSLLAWCSADSASTCGGAEFACWRDELLVNKVEAIDARDAGGPGILRMKFIVAFGLDSALENKPLAEGDA